MSKASLIRIDKIEVERNDLAKIKKLFKITDNAEAMKKALCLVSGKIELENIFGRESVILGLL